MFIIYHLQNEKTVDRILIISDCFLEKEKQKDKVSEAKLTKFLRFKIFISFNCKLKIFRSLELRRMNQS